MSSKKQTTGDKAMMDHNMTNRVLTDKTLTKMAEAVRLGKKADKAAGNATDLLIANGFDSSTDYLSPDRDNGHTCTAEEYAQLRVGVIMGFSKVQRDLLEASKDEAKTWTKTRKKARRAASMEVGAKIQDFGAKVKRREAKADRESGGAGSRNRPLDQRVRDNLNDVIKVCQNAEEATFDVTDMVATIKHALRMLDTTKAEE
jgi:hypothetical protein|tara:strand:- start:256 stop:861 length:606 start_codon:yes stop_codon:yes gene_type:complete